MSFNVYCLIGSFCFSPLAWLKNSPSVYRGSTRRGREYLCYTRPMAAKLADNKVGYWIVLLLTVLKHNCARWKTQASLVLTHRYALSPLAWLKNSPSVYRGSTRRGREYLCFTRLMAAKLTDNKSMVLLFNGNHSAHLVFVAVSLLWDVNVQHSVLHLCLNLVGVGIVGQDKGLLEPGI